MAFVKYSCLILTLLFLAFPVITVADEPPVVEIPRFNHLVDLAIKHGSVDWLVGIRPFADTIVIGFGKELRLKGNVHPVYHAYGFGGAGLTLSPGVAKQAVDDFADSDISKQQPILIVGAGITGLSIARALAQAQYKKISIVSAFYPPGAEKLIKGITPVTKEHFYASCIAGGYIMPVKFGATTQQARTKSIIENAQQQWESLSKNPMYAPIVKPGNRITMLPIQPNQVLDYNYDAMAINKLLGYKMFPIEVNHVKLMGITSNNQPFERKANTVVTIHNIIQVDPVSVQLSYIKELIASRYVTFAQASIPYTRILHDHVQPEHIIVNASGNGMGRVFNVPEITPVRGDLVIATLPLKYTTNHPSRHYAFYTPGMTLHQRFDPENMTIVFGTTNIKGDDSTHFSHENTRRILKHWYIIAHCPHSLSVLTSEQPQAGTAANCNLCNAEANGFADKVINAFPKHPAFDSGTD